MNSEFTPIISFPIFWSLIRGDAPAMVNLFKFNKFEGGWRRKEGLNHHHFQCFSYIKCET